MLFEKEIEAAIAAGLDGFSLSSLGAEWEARGNRRKMQPIVRVDLNPITALRKVLQESRDSGEAPQLGVSKESLRELENAIDRLILVCWAETIEGPDDD